jgi:hypothetical protein
MFQLCLEMRSCVAGGFWAAVEGAKEIEHKQRYTYIAEIGIRIIVRRKHVFKKKFKTITPISVGTEL